MNIIIAQAIFLLNSESRVNKSTLISELDHEIHENPEMFKDHFSEIWDKFNSLSKDKAQILVYSLKVVSTQQEHTILVKKIMTSRTKVLACQLIAPVEQLLM